MCIVQLTSESQAFYYNSLVRRMEVPGGITTMEGVIQDPNTDVAVYTRATDGTVHILCSNRLALIESSKGAGEVVQHPKEWMFNNEKELVESLRFFLQSVPSQASGEGRRYLDHVRNMIDNSVMFGHLPKDRRPNILVYIEQDPDPKALRNNYAGMHYFRVVRPFEGICA